MRLVYTQEAIADLIRLRDFVAIHNPTAAERIAASLVSGMNYLAEFPNLGTPVPEAPPDGNVRDVIFGKYIARYSAHREAVTVLRIWHHFEDRSGKT